MEGRLLLDVVIRQGAPILKLLASKNQTLLVRWDAFLVLNLCLHIFNRIARLHFKSDRLTGEGLDEDLHAATQTEDQVEGRLLLDVVIRQGAPILKLLASKNQTLLVRWDAFLVLNLCLHIFNRIARLHFKSDRLAGERLDEDLHDGL